MSEITVKQQINAPPESVFETLTDYANRADIVSAVKSIELLSDGPISKGTRFRETQMMHGREASEEMEITQFDPPSSFVLEAHNHGAHYKTSHRLDRAGDGTLVSLTFAATATNPIAKIMGMLLMPFMKRSIVRCIEDDLADLKRHLEDPS